MDKSGDNEETLYKDTLPVVVFGDHTLAVKFVDFPFCVGADGTQILKPDEKIIIGKFLYYAILNLNIHSLGYSRHFKILKVATFRVPEIEIQKRIVKILDQADALRQKRKLSIELLDVYLKSVFIDMFGDPVKNPKAWETVLLDKTIESIKYGTSTPPIFSDSGKSFIRATNIKNGRIIDNDMKFISIEESVKIKKCQLRKGDFILVRSGVNTGDSAVITDRYDCDFGGYDLIVKFNKLVNPIFIGKLFVSSFLEKMIKPLTRRAAQPHLNANQVKKLTIFVPPIELQNKFSEIVEKTEILNQKMLDQSKELERQFQALMQKSFNN